MKLVKGDRVLWFDHRLWKNKDIGNNDHCRKMATVVRSYTGSDGRPAIDLKFDHNSFVSKGHFNYHPYDEAAIAQKATSVKI